ncbi:MAG TPA: MmgE/PrpD family protein [Xanthobacteraceae bacterium]|nr:MmgE/PrpD family protein [Xanthobacteraceae bacterium]
MQVTEGLARFLLAHRPEDLPERVRHEAKRSLVNFFAAALGGCRNEAVEILLGALTDGFGPPQATVIGRSERTDALTATFLNAVSANVLDFDDTHLRTVIHPTAPVAPGLFALAERRPIAGAALLHAFALGVEVECRIGNALSPGHYRRGWHITATCGVLGAAAAAGKLLGLAAQRMGWALGTAATQSSGLVENLGTMSKSVGVGNAARNGLAAALYAERGLSGPDRPLEGPRGLAAVMGEGEDLASVVQGLGESWELMANAYKPYPCGVVLHPVIDACLELRPKVGDVERIERIVVKGHPLLRERADRPDVTAGREAQVSLQHSVAVAFLHGAAGVKEYGDACVNDPAVLALRRKVYAEDDASIPADAAVVSLRTAAGEMLSAHIAHARGSLARPLSDRELEAKLRDLAAFSAPGIDPERLIDALWALDQTNNAAALMSSAVASAK